MQTNGNCLLQCMNGGSCVNGTCICTSHYLGPACQYGNHIRKKTKLKYSTFVYLIENPCIHQNQCLNSGTCIGQYNPNEILSAQCICLPGFTGNICEGKTIQDIK